MLFGLLYFGRRLAVGSEPRDPARFHITMYVLPDTSLFELQDVSEVSSISSNEDAIAVIEDNEGGEQKVDYRLDPGDEEIERHLMGHGRVRRKFWREMIMFVWDRSAKGGGEDSRGV
jgi:hypothetical protein